MKHKVKIHRWINGFLKIDSHESETLEEALDFARHATENVTHTAKIYDDAGELVHTIADQNLNTYA
jgi:hypothetical protein